MKKLLLCGIAMALYLGDAEAGNGPGKRLASISQQKVKYESSRELMKKYAKMEDDAHRAHPNAVSPPVQQRNSNPNSTQSVTFVDLGQSLNPFTSVATQRNYVSVVPALNTVAVFRRGGPGDPAGTTNAAGNKLFYDYSTNGGANWTLRPGNLHTDDIYTTWPTYSATFNYGSRYPQGLIWNPPGNTNIANAQAFGTSAVLDGTNGPTGWGGLGRGWRGLTAPTNAGSSYAMWNSQDPILHYIGDGIETAPNGDIFFPLPELDAEAGAFTDKIIIYKFSYNSATNRFDSSLVLLPFPNEPGDYATVVGNSAISFAPTGGVGYLAMNAYNIAYDSTMTFSLYLSKTTDGGSTWSDFKVVSVNYKNDVDNTEDIDAFRDQMFANFVKFTETSVISANRGDEYAHRVDYFVKDLDLTVDQYGYAHVLAEFVITSFGDTLANDPGNLVFYPGYGAWYADITISDMSQPARGDVIGQSDNVRGCFGDCSATATSFTEDNRPQITRSADGSTITMVWFATDEEAHPATSNFNSNPDLWMRTISTPSAGTFVANDQMRNMTKGSDYDGLVVCGNVSPIMLNRPAGGYEVAASCVSLAPFPGVTSPWTTQHLYIRGLNTSDTIATPLTPKVLKSNSILTGKNAALLPLTLFPNPGNGKVVAQLFAKESGMAQLRIVNNVGQEIANTSIMVPKGEVKIPVNLQAMPTGIYFVSIQLNGQRASQRLIKE